jgi:hypothetical protein
MLRTTRVPAAQAHERRLRRARKVDDCIAVCESRVQVLRTFGFAGLGALSGPTIREVIGRVARGGALGRLSRAVRDGHRRGDLHKAAASARSGRNQTEARATPPRGVGRTLGSVLALPAGRARLPDDRHRNRTEAPATGPGALSDRGAAGRRLRRHRDSVPRSHTARVTERTRRMGAGLGHGSRRALHPRQVRTDHDGGDGPLPSTPQDRLSGSTFASCVPPYRTWSNRSCTIRSMAVHD